MKPALLAIAVLLIAGSCHSGLAHVAPRMLVSAPRFQGTELKTLPMQSQPWMPPESDLPASFVSQVRKAFTSGVADPRECDYREIDASALEPRSLLTRPGAEYLDTRHGWVLPVERGDRYRFAIQWDGLVYPVFGSGKKVSLAADVHAVIRRHRRSPAGLLARDPDLPALLPALLLRLGEGALANEVWTALGASTQTINPLKEWEDNLLDRATRDHMRRDDRLALIRLRMLAKRQSTPDLIALLTDQERRARERMEEAPPMEIPGSIEALICDLDQVNTQPSGLDSPGAPDLGEDPRVKALVGKGIAAIRPLATCLAEDTRLTRSSAQFRVLEFSSTMAPVAEAAYEALRGILGGQVLAGIESGVPGVRGTSAYRQALSRAILAQMPESKGGIVRPS